MSAKPTPPDDLWERLDALNKEMNLSAPDATGFTSEEYAERFKTSIVNARWRLLGMEKAGKVVVGYRNVRGRRMKVYRLVDDE